MESVVSELAACPKCGSRSLDYCSEDCTCGGGEQLRCKSCDWEVRPEDGWDGYEELKERHLNAWEDQ